MDYYILKYFNEEHRKDLFGTSNLEEVDHFSDSYYAVVGYVLALKEDEMLQMSNAVKKAISELFSKKG